MADDKLAPKPPSVKITGKPNTSPLHARINEAEKEKKAYAQADPLVVENRIAIMADGSGSMSGFKNRCLHDALQGFFQMCNFADTSCSIFTFGNSPEMRYNLSRDQAFLITAGMGIGASGGTPMADAMEDTLAEVSLTRGIIISDGQPDSTSAVLEQAEIYKEQEIPIDCIHIGESSHGEDLLKQVAKITGGIYIKFDNAGSFASAFSWLTPAKRGQLTEKIAGLLGAKEIKL